MKFADEGSKFFKIISTHRILCILRDIKIYTARYGLIVNTPAKSRLKAQELRVDKGFKKNVIRSGQTLMMTEEGSAHD